MTWDERLELSGIIGTLKALSFIANQHGESEESIAKFLDESIGRIEKLIEKDSEKRLDE